MNKFLCYDACIYFITSEYLGWYLNRVLFYKRKIVLSMQMPSVIGLHNG